MKRSWGLVEIIHQDSTQTNSLDELQAKGIFILPKEANMEVWKTISNAGSPTDISRLYDKNPVNYSVYKRLIGGQWLNDDGINAYITLMRQKKGTFICTTYDFPLLVQKRVIPLKKKVRALINFHALLLLTEMKAIRQDKPLQHI
jgi:hypothetical protein